MAVGILSGRQVAQEQKEDPLDKIAKGLNIAQSVFGIATNIDTLSKNKQIRDSQLKEAELKAAQAPLQQRQAEAETIIKESQAKGVPSEFEVFKSLVPSQEGAPGSFGLSYMSQEDGKIRRGFFKQKEDPYAALLKPLQVQALGQQLKKGAEPKQEEKQANIYYNRMASAEKVFNTLPQDKLVSVYRKFDDFTSNALKDPDVKRFYQAVRNFSSAVLRKESGAAISPAEFDQVREQYFPVSGDDPETLAQKSESRQQVIAGMKELAGPALKTLATEKESGSGADNDRKAKEALLKKLIGK